MQVQQLTKALEGFPPEAEVIFQAGVDMDAGDLARSVLDIGASSKLQAVCVEISTED